MDFTGRWVGQTIGAPSPQHYWTIFESKKRLKIYTCWEGESALTQFDGILAPDGVFFIDTFQGYFAAFTRTEDSFTIPKWAFAKAGEQWIPMYDVVFHRRETGLKGRLYRGVLRVFGPRLWRVLK